MTQYFDKHGTQIFKGDRIRFDWTGAPGDAIEGPMSCTQSPEWYARCAVVLSRADGTPVYRYKGGEDVRVGDTFRNPNCAGDLTIFGAIASCDGWSNCTLLRRADSPRELSSTALVAQRPELAPKDDRPILGKDRNGREVRRLDKLRLVLSNCVFQVMFGNDRTVTGDITSRGSSGLRIGDSINEYWEYTELVTDEKPESSLFAGAGNIGSTTFAKDGPDMFEAAEQATEAGKILESTCRALAGPTLAERYAEFRQTVASIISTSCADLDVEAVTDVAKEQFLLRLRIGPDWEQSLWWPSRGPWEAVRAEINRSVKIVEIELGRKALKKARVLGKGDEAQLASGKAMNALKDSAREAVETKP